jgi:LEA14-like dessication related protein
MYTFIHFVVIKIILNWNTNLAAVTSCANALYLKSCQQGEGREGVETAIHRASPSVMRASRWVKRSKCKQIWLRVYDPSEGMLKLLLYKILLV